MRSHVIVSKQTEVPEHDRIVNWFQRLGFDFNVSCIAIKPNLCCYRPSESGATTDPLLIRSIVRAIHFMNPHAKCVIVESNTWAVDADLAFSVLGYRRIVGKEPNTSFINLTKEVKQHIAFNGHFFNGFEAPLILHEADALISVPKLKTMVVDVMTGCLKNQFGCNPDPQKDKYHIHLSKVIADLNILFRPTISLVDGLLAQDVTGPAHGRIRKANLYIIGNDPVSVDTEILYK